MTALLVYERQQANERCMSPWLQSGREQGESPRIHDSCFRYRNDKSRSTGTHKEHSAVMDGAKGEGRA